MLQDNRLNKMLQRIERANERKERRLSVEQMEHYSTLLFWEAKKAAEYSRTTNYPDLICDAMARRDGLNIVTTRG